MIMERKPLVVVPGLVNMLTYVSGRKKLKCLEMF